MKDKAKIIQYILVVLVAVSLASTYIAYNQYTKTKEEVEELEKKVTSLKENLDKLQSKQSSILEELEAGKVEVKSIDLPSLKVGQTGTISATVVNKGESKKSQPIKLKIDGKIENSKTVEVAPDKTATLSFRIKVEESGKHTVQLGSEIGSLKVIHLSIKDDRGQTVKISKVPERIVSISPVATEILFALGAGDRVVGVDKYANYPPGAVEMKNSGELKIVGGYATLSVEKVISLNPDLVIVGGYQSSSKSRLRKIEKMGIPTLCFVGENIPDAISDIETIGGAVGTPLAAESLAENMRNKLQEVREKTVVLSENERPKVFWQVWWNPIYTVGSGTFLNDIIQTAEGRNIFSDREGWIQVGKETVINRNPEVYCVSPHSEKTVKQVKNTAGFGSIDAVKNDRVYSVPKDIFSRPGPRLVDAVRVLAYLLHPDEFKRPTLPYARVPETSG